MLPRAQAGIGMRLFVGDDKAVMAEAAELAQRECLANKL